MCRVSSVGSNSGLVTICTVGWGRTACARSDQSVYIQLYSRVGPSLSRGLTARAPSAPTHTSTNTPTRTGVPPRVRTTMAVPKIPYIRRALDCIASVRVPLSPS